MLDFNTFEKAINQIIANCRHDDRITNALSVEGFTTVFIDTNNTIVDILKVVMKDESDLIEYYLWDTNFGENWLEGDFKVDGIDIPLATVEDLYKALTRKV